MAQKSVAQLLGSLLGLMLLVTLSTRAQNAQQTLWAFGFRVRSVAGIRLKK
jgi:hypothetical protein